MQTIALLALGAILLAAPVLAQPAREAGAAPPSTEAPRQGADRPPSSPGATVDRGPHTPEANRAHGGGGVVLQGAPGAPAPSPAPTSPGQAARDAAPATH